MFLGWQGQRQFTFFERWNSLLISHLTTNKTRHTYNNAHAQMCDFIIAYINYITLTRAILDLALGSVRINAI